jgi:hypothetical protein
MKIDREDFNRKAQHIVDAVVKPQVEKYERAKAIEKAAEEFAKNHSIYPTAQDDTEYGFKHGAKWMEQQMEQQMEKLKDFDAWKEWKNKPE